MVTLLRALLLFFAFAPAFVAAQQPITLNDVEVGLPDITAYEPYAAEFSAEKAAQYLDRSALNWQKTKKCATCHTNLFYMAARPALKTILPDSGEVRSFYEDYRKVRWKKSPTEAQVGRLAKRNRQVGEIERLPDESYHEPTITTKSPPISRHGRCHHGRRITQSCHFATARRSDS